LNKGETWHAYGEGEGESQDGLQSLEEEGENYEG